MPEQKQQFKPGDRVKVRGRDKGTVLSREEALQAIPELVTQYGDQFIWIKLDGSGIVNGWLPANVVLLDKLYDFPARPVRPVALAGRPEMVTMPVTKCPRCQGPRDPQNPKPAYTYQCGCLVKWDKEALEPKSVHLTWPVNGEPTWNAVGQSVVARHPVRETAIAMWREKVWAAK